MQQGQERRDRAPRAPTGTGGVHTVTQTLPDGSKRKFKMIGSARTGAEELDRTCEHAGHWIQMPPPAELCSTLNSITMRLLQLFDKAVQDSGEEGEGVTSLALTRLGSQCEEYWIRSECYEALLANNDVPRICLTMAVDAVAHERGCAPASHAPAEIRATHRCRYETQGFVNAVQHIVTAELLRQPPQNASSSDALDKHVRIVLQGMADAGLNGCVRRACRCDLCFMTQFCRSQRGEISSKGFDVRAQRWNVQLFSDNRKLSLEAKHVAIDTSRPRRFDLVSVRPSLKALFGDIAVQQVASPKKSTATPNPHPLHSEP